jgi:hypothetical protein
MGIIFDKIQENLENARLYRELSQVVREKRRTPATHAFLAPPPITTIS